MASRVQKIATSGTWYVVPVTDDIFDRLNPKLWILIKACHLNSNLDYLIWLEKACENSLC